MKWSARWSSWASAWVSRPPSPALSTPAPSCWIGGAVRASEQPLVSDDVHGDRDDHDRKPAIRLDVVRQAAAGGSRLEPSKRPMGVHALHPFPDLGATPRWLA